MYERILDPYSIGSAHQRLAGLSDGAKRREHVRRAREAWASIDREDLIEGLDAEFGSDA